jgi:hypothetical protein
MSPVLIERALNAWERGAGLDVTRRARMALESLADRDPSSFGEEAMALYQRDGELLALRRSLFGSSLDAVVRCPGCGVEFGLDLDLSALAEATPPAEPVRIALDDFVAVVRPPREDDLVALQTWAGSASELADRLFSLCIVDAACGADKVAAADLPIDMRALAAAAISDRGMESPGVDLTCGECGNAWRAPLDIARDLLGELDGWVARFLHDVHRIAAAYHWSERDIMALPMRRRLYYLEAIA